MVGPYTTIIIISIFCHLGLPSEVRRVEPNPVIGTAYIFFGVGVWHPKVSLGLMMEDDAFLLYGWQELIDAFPSGLRCCPPCCMEKGS